MSYKSSLLYPLFILCISLSSISAAEWLGVYGGEKNESTSSVFEDGQGGFIIIGETQSYGAGGEDIYIVGLDSLGDSLWYKTYGFEKGDHIKSVQGDAENGIYILAESDLHSTDSTNHYTLYKCDTKGDTIWTRPFNRSNDDWFVGMAITADANDIKILFATSNSTLILLSRDSSGSFSSSTDITVNTDQYINQMKLGEDDQLYLIGSVYDTIEVDGKKQKTECAYLAEIGPSGTPIREGAFTSDNFSYFRYPSFTPTKDGGFALVGHALGYSTETMAICQVLIIKVNNNWEKVWEQVFEYDNENSANSIIEFPNGRIAAIGTSHNGSNTTYGNTMSTYWVHPDGSKFSSRGVVDIAEFNPYASYGSFINATADGSAIIGGRAEIQGDHQMVVLKMDSIGQTSVINTSSSQSDFSIVTSQKNGMLTIQSGVSGPLSVRLTTLQGRELIQKSFTNSANCAIDLTTLRPSSGVYLLTVSGEMGSKQMKVILR